MTNKPNLAAALAANKVDQKSSTSKEPKLPQLASESAPSSSRQAGRVGQSNISGWFDKSVKFTLEELRLKRQRELGRRVTVQEIMAEAYNDLFKKYGFPEVAPTKSEG